MPRDGFEKLNVERLAAGRTVQKSAQCDGRHTKTARFAGLCQAALRVLCMKSSVKLLGLRRTRDFSTICDGWDCRSIPIRRSSAVWMRCSGRCKSGRTSG